MSYDWTKEELLQELNERKAEGESEEMTFDFIWAVVERAYQERDQFVGATEAERAAVVAWLRSEAESENPFYAQSNLDYAATMIERGEHRRKED